MSEKEKKKKSTKKKDSKKEKIISSKKEILTEEKKEIPKEVLEELLEEETYVDNTQIQHILANPWKEVSLEKRGIEPISNLEDLPKRKIEKDEEKENIEYALFKGVEEGKYQSPMTDTKFENTNLGEEEKSLDEQKRLYEKMQNSSEDLKPEKNSGIEYIKPEDTMKKDYLTKRKFF